MSKYKIHLGSISTGTLRTVDLWSAIVWEADRIRMSKEDRSKVNKLGDEFENASEEEQPDILDELWDIVSSYAPPYVSLRMSEWDGANLGWWPEIDAIEDEIRSRSGLIQKANAGEPWPHHEWDEEPEFVLEVNDHGNCTLKYACNGREIWSCV